MFASLKSQYVEMIFISLFLVCKQKFFFADIHGISNLQNVLCFPLSDILISNIPWFFNEVFYGYIS